MKISLKALLTVSALSAFTAIAPAATVIWETPANITGDTNISTTGTLDRAYNFGDWNTVATTINGVMFSRFATIHGTQTSVTVGQTTLSATTVLGAYGGFGDAAAPYANLSPAYKNLLTQGIWKVWEGMTLTLSGLTAGHTYQFQTFGNDSASVDNRGGTVTGGANTATLDYNIGNVLGGTGQFVIGSFTADSTSQTISYANEPTVGMNIVNGFQLRETAVPEPDALYLVLFAGAAFFVVRRMRKSSKHASC